MDSWHYNFIVRRYRMGRGAQMNVTRALIAGQLGSYQNLKAIGSSMKSTIITTAVC